MLKDKIYQEALTEGLWNSLKAALICSLMIVVFMIVRRLPEVNSFIFILIIGIPIVSILVSFICTVIILIPSTILLNKIGYDKKICIVMIGIVLGIILWYVFDVAFEAIYIIELYAAICSYSFIWRYEQILNKIDKYHVQT